jgi:MerR family mercuric resistance operon transcriptional regulator
MGLTIGRVAKRADVSVETVRYYERRGLVRQPLRTGPGYRQYAEETVDRIRFIKRAQDLGFSLKEITELLQLRIRSATACGAVERRARKKMALVEQKIRELSRMRAVLERLARACQAKEPTGDCPILEALEEKESIRA